MDENESEAGGQLAANRPADVAGWSLTRIEVGTSIFGNKRPVAHVELEQTTRGRVSRRVRARPFQVSGIDENDDLWIFASSDKGAAKAIEEEFIGEGYSEIRLLV